ncbi:C-type lectin domain family 4 member F-like [Rhea pennata]|uniref:C-type lectin domain family 4 member F-like n=1 Tax=Rhea pennata TaxID=8795 RepID=UPI002E270436
MQPGARNGEFLLKYLQGVCVCVCVCPRVDKRPRAKFPFWGFPSALLPQAPRRKQPRGCAAPGGAASCRERLGRWLQRLSIGWRYHDGNIYYFSRSKKTWEDSEAFCTAVKAHLASISSAEEQEYIAGQAGNLQYWIGLTDRVKEGTWRWVDGTEYKPGVR